MRYSTKDIEILIVTYNRADMLSETLESIKGQTLQGFSVIVLDNGSTDNTPEIVKKFGYNISKNETNQGHKGNFEKALQIASKKWTILFHDDDLMHPKYIETVLEYLNKYPEVAFVGSNCTATKKPSNKNWNEINKPQALLCDKHSFAALSCVEFLYHFASSIYRTDLFKKAKFKWDEYSKICDKPFLFDVLGDKKAIVFANSDFIQYRIHPGQDTVDYKSGPFAKHWINLQKIFADNAGCSIFNINSLIYTYNCYSVLGNGYSWIKADYKNYSKQEFEKLADKDNLILLFAKVQKTLVTNKITRGLATKFFNAYYQKLEQKFFNDLKVE